ncbi:MAG: hypothetical protein K0R29_927 [Pseudobdellovibrio sp.]|nr:hypothetical protein [Pseudobdellovibrio sp.]
MYHQSWSPEAKTEFEKIISAHGGWQAWSQFSDFSFTIKQFSGFLLLVKGQHRSFNSPQNATINPKTKTLIFDYGTHQDTYADGKLILASGKTVEDGKTLFTKGVFEQWTPAHMLYFFGYALVNYAGYPFILPEHELLNFQLNENKSYFEIRFPEGFRTHSRVQRFYFDKRHLLVRHDYRAELAGPFVFGAHETHDYKEYKGLQMAQTRKVKPRLWKWGFRPYGIYAELIF